MKKKPALNILRNINITIGLLVLLANIIAFIFCDSNKSNFILISIFLNGLIFFFHWFIFAKETKVNLNEMKRESLYINYPLNIGTFIFCMFLILIISAITLFSVNKDAFNLAFVFTFFMSVLSMLAPSILLLVYVIFLIPALILPGISLQYAKEHHKDILWIILILLVGFVFLSGFKYVTYSLRSVYIDQESKFKIIKLPIQYSTQYLKLKDISPYGKKRLSSSKVSVPFVYTADAINNKDIESAERFCNSMGARVPNYLEAYNIVFNKFNTFGEKYYWTVNKDGRTPLVIHFKNMSYTVEKYNNKTKPILFCVANSNDNSKILNKNYLYRDFSKDNNVKNKKNEFEKPFGNNINNNFFEEGFTKNSPSLYENDQYNDDYNLEKKHVNFSVKEVSSDIMEGLIRKGYEYNPQLKINTRYETNDQAFAAKIIRDINKKQMRLCYYPFTDYGNLSIGDEAQIWKQSFCSPSFVLIKPIPVPKSKVDKDSYCSSLGGRLPNIPELNGILKTLNITGIGTKYWINTKVNQFPVLVYYKDSRFMQVKVLNRNENENAYAYCIKSSSSPSKVIANYKSRFTNIEGSSYAKAQCPNCQYYEVPDTVVLSY